MKSLPPLLVAVTSLIGGLTTPSSSFFANAQQPTIEVCQDGGEINDSTCETTEDRVCYKYVEAGEQKCGACRYEYIEFEGKCEAIKDITTEGGFVILSALLDLFLPEYIDKTVTTLERGVKLAAAATLISFWESKVPPQEFKLGFTMETFLTEEERAGRLGITPGVIYEDDGVNGEMGRFEHNFISSGPDDYGNDENAGGEDGIARARRLNARKLEDVPSPPAVDWEAEGYTTVVKNQGLCGCCWAVSVTGAVESALMITGQTDRYDNMGENSLSFQQLISCDDKEKGCSGGNILQATRFVWEHDDFENGNKGGMVSYKDWPYEDILGTTTDTCEHKGKKPTDFTPAAYLNYPKIVNSVNDRTSFEERRDRLKYAVSKQPVINVLRSGCPLLMNYKEGVLTHDIGCECSETSCIDHATVVTGYNTTHSPPYWKVRNSWGSGFGENGYFKVAMDNPGAGDWGLFGMLAESAVPSEAYRSLEDLPERPGWWETAQTWEKAMVIIASIVGFCCLCGCLGALFKKFRSAPEA